MSNFFCKYQSPLDEITIASNGSDITGLWFTRQKHFDAKLGENTANSDLPIFTKARAVGGAVGRNPISIFVPCHRVVGSNDKLTGYAGGIEKKIKLLKLENIL